MKDQVGCWYKVLRFLEVIAVIGVLFLLIRGCNEWLDKPSVKYESVDDYYDQLPH